MRTVYKNARPLKLISKGAPLRQRALDTSMVKKHHILLTYKAIHVPLKKRIGYDCFCTTVSLPVLTQCCSGRGQIKHMELNRHKLCSCPILKAVLLGQGENLNNEQLKCRRGASRRIQRVKVVVQQRWVLDRLGLDHLSCDGYLIDDKCLTYMKNMAMAAQDTRGPPPRATEVCVGPSTGAGPMSASTLLAVEQCPGSQNGPQAAGLAGEAGVGRSFENVLYNCMQHFEVTATC
jgi:hypothetical protein